MSHINDSYIRSVVNCIDLKGKKILEVGCGNGKNLRALADQYHPEMIIGIDINLDSWWKVNDVKGENWEIKEGDVLSLDFPDNYFDGVISVATFEHILDIPKALSEIKRVLKPFGRFYTEFAPIWTSIIGHHYDFWISKEKAQLIPPWGHLYMDEGEMYDYLIGKVGSEEAKKACYEIYHSGIINRISRKEFYNAFSNAGMWVRQLNEHICFSRARHFGVTESELSEEVLHKIKNSNIELGEIGTFGFSVLLEKYFEIK